MTEFRQLLFAGGVYVADGVGYGARGTGIIVKASAS